MTGLPSIKKNIRMIEYFSLLSVLRLMQLSNYSTESDLLFFSDLDS